MSHVPPDNPYQSNMPEGKPGFPHEPPRTSGKAIASLICGLLSPVTCGIGSILAMIFGFMGLSDIKNSGGQVKGTGLATSGIVLAAMGFALAPIAILVLLLLPAINAAREAARRNGCLSNARQLGLAAANHESATKRYPLASDSLSLLAGPQAAAPGSVGENGQGAGYSWQVKLLPYMEERIVYDQIQQSSNKFEAPAFDPSISGGGGHPAQIQIPALRCPSYVGDPIATASEYEGGIGNVTVGNYVALSGTHLKADGTLDENGVIISKMSDGQGQFRGTGMRDVRDGISMTIILCESREQRYGSWYDGQAAWVTALRTDVTENDFGADALNRLPTAPLDSAALNAGGDSDPYFPAHLYAGQEDRLWGPSSHHSGGVVMHVYADAHAQAIVTGVDPTVYMSFVTRSGGEPVRGFELD